MMIVVWRAGASRALGDEGAVTPYTRRGTRLRNTLAGGVSTGASGRRIAISLSAAIGVKERLLLWGGIATLF